MSPVSAAGEPAAPREVVNVTLLPEVPGPTAFTALRPITILQADAKIRSKLTLRQTEAHDGRNCPDARPAAAQMGFRRGYQCAEVIAIVRDLLERCTEWDTPLCVSQMDFARAYDSIKHAALIRAMERRDVPRPVIAAYLRELRSARMVFRHSGWATEGIAPSVGLRQGCSVSPMIFRWTMEEVFEAVKPQWEARGCGLSIDGSRMTHICWAYDMWLIAQSAAELDWMIGSLEQAAHDIVGLDLRLGKCKWARIHRRGRDAPELRPSAARGNLRRMTELPAGQCLGVLGAYVQTDGGHDLEYKETISV